MLGKFDFPFPQTDPLNLPQPSPARGNSLRLSPIAHRLSLIAPSIHLNISTSHHLNLTQKKLGDSIPCGRINPSPCSCNSRITVLLQYNIREVPRRHQSVFGEKFTVAQNPFLPKVWLSGIDAQNVIAVLLPESWPEVGKRRKPYTGAVWLCLVNHRGHEGISLI
jgi:hypothetical protein